MTFGLIADKETRELAAIKDNLVLILQRAFPCTTECQSPGLGWLAYARSAPAAQA
jgi:hypothetical protein